MTENTSAHLDCAACRAIDAFDGVTDGVLFSPDKFHVADERKRWQGVLDAQDRAADRVTDFAGSLRFVYIHSVWFGIWVVLNIGILGASLKFDPFPFGLLTMIVSLEAIFLSTFVMVSQNRQAKRSDLRAQMDFETNLRAEIWAIHIGAKLGIDHDHVEDVVKQAIAASNSTEAPRGL
ncbi:MAG: DUF1003 domain-containing protein [Acidobacteria bacterium]|nr:DUF1003 domain-containing protein [Acidobacteriota bacterium]